MASETDGGIQGVKAARNQALWREVNERIRAPFPRFTPRNAEVPGF
jgi:hypothetical protein